MELGFDKALSQAAFERTLYLVLRANCAGCHNTDTRAQAPIHADLDVNLAHEYALTRVNFYHPADSKLVVRKVVDRHNCFGRSCSGAGMPLLQKIQGWVGAIQNILPEIPRGVPGGTMLSEPEITQWIAADRAAQPAASAAYVAYVSLHEVHNAGVSAQRLNVARAAVSKALSSTARWAPNTTAPNLSRRLACSRFPQRPCAPRKGSGHSFVAHGPCENRALRDPPRKIGSSSAKLILGPNKNLHVEPIVWAFEWAQAHHGYSDTTSN